MNLEPASTRTLSKTSPRKRTETAAMTTEHQKERGVTGSKLQAKLHNNTSRQVAGVCPDYPNLTAPKTIFKYEDLFLLHLGVRRTFTSRKRSSGESNC